MVMIGIYNILNYFFQISMARILGPAEYGVLSVLMSIVYIFGIPGEAIQTIVTSYTSKFNVQENNGKIKDLLYRSLKKGFIISLIAFLVFIPVSLIISNALKIDVWLIILTGLLLIYSFTIPISRGVLQGKKKFKLMGGNLIIESLTKLATAVFLVLIGLEVYGSIGGLIFGGIIAFLLVIFSLKDVIKSNRERENFDGIFLSSLPTFVAMTSMVLIYSIDVIMARMFFAPEIAGKYAFASLIGKTILFSSFAIGKSMFPLTSENYEKKIDTKNIFNKSLSIVSILAFSALILFLFFPELIIKLLSLGDVRYSGVSSILFVLGIAFSFAAYSYILMLYNLSIKKMKYSSFGLLIFVILEIVLLSIFSNKLINFSISLAIVNLLMLIYNICITAKK